MLGCILARKLGMTQIFAKNGDIIPITVLEAGPCTVVHKKTLEKDGYKAIQLAFLPKRASRVNKPLLGHFKKANVESFYCLREFRVEGLEDFKIGQKITVDEFKIGDQVDITGISKGRGFAGVIKRWGFKRGPETHGSRSHRIPGSIGTSTFPGRVIKGRKMAGHMGDKRVTIKNLTVVEVRPEQHLLLLKGAVPGSKNSLLMIKKVRKD